MALEDFQDLMQTTFLSWLLMTYLRNVLGEETLSQASLTKTTLVLVTSGASGVSEA